MEHGGIDVHKRESQICILTEDGKLVERRIRSEVQRFTEVLGEHPPARILLEAGTESEWVARCLERLGHEVLEVRPHQGAVVLRQDAAADIPGQRAARQGEAPAVA